MSKKFIPWPHEIMATPPKAFLLDIRHRDRSLRTIFHCNNCRFKSEHCQTDFFTNTGEVNFFGDNIAKGCKVTDIVYDVINKSELPVSVYKFPEPEVKLARLSISFPDSTGNNERNNFRKRLLYKIRRSKNICL